MSEERDKICSVLKAVMECLCSGVIPPEDIEYIINYSFTLSIKDVNKEDFERTKKIASGAILTNLAGIYPSLASFIPLIRFQMNQ